MNQSLDHPLQQAVSCLQGVGPKLSVALDRLGLKTIADMLFHLPLRYEDRTKIKPIAQLQPQDHVLIEGYCDGARIVGQRKMLLCQLRDDTGVVSLRFFNFYYKQFQTFNKPGVKLRCYGELRSGYRSGLEMIHPEYQVIREGVGEPLVKTLTPVYPMTKGLAQKRLRSLVQQAMCYLTEKNALVELLPLKLQQQLSVSLSLVDALHTVHCPPANVDVKQLQQGTHPAQQRLAVEELLAHYLSLQQLRSRYRAKPTYAINANTELVPTFIQALPFTLTSAQNRVLDDIRRDFSLEQPMLRLVQGDVGSGKTVVAAAAILQVIASGFQAVFMAPTELLAQQHMNNFTAWLEPLGVKVALLTGHLPSGKRRELLTQLAQGEINVVVGTHAVFQDSVVFSRLALIVIDEQHRFGVEQRLALINKGLNDGRHPHQLIMTATPIPRTLAMTAYGDLDVSMIDELPPGRKPINTVVMSQDKRADVIARINDHVRLGAQVYWVCTLIDESEALQAKAAISTADELQSLLPNLRVGLAHAGLKAQDKQTAMACFTKGELNVLVATTVVEVGVDVPNASLIVIENPERLGLAQLHQLRGRVGRGTAQSYCVLMFQSPLSLTAKRRLGIMRQTQDGFVIAEEDLSMRGPGDVLGVRQSGLLEFKVANLIRDKALISQVQCLGQCLLKDYPQQAQKLINRWVRDKQQLASV